MNHERLYHSLLAWRHRATHALDRISRWLLITPPAADTPLAAAGRVARVGVWVMVAVFGFGGAWAALAPLDSAAVAPGQVVLGSARKSIQHLEGGIVDQILVHEGQRVKAGQLLVQLHATASRAKLDTLTAERFVARATEARLMAERDHAAEVRFPDAATTDEQREALANQQKIFAARTASRQAQSGILEQKIAQHRQEIAGLNEQIESETRQIALLGEQIAPIQRLLAKGYASKPRLLELQARMEQLRGDRGRNQAAVAAANQAVAEAELQRENFNQQVLADIVKELKDTQLQLADLNPQITSSGDVLSRIAVTAPVDGYVTGLNIHTKGGVIAPGEKLMEIVPTGDKLIVEAQVSPQDIDVVHPGLAAHIRLTAYKTRHMPVLEGKVLTISADRMTDAKTGAAYYLARIEADAHALKRLRGITLYPGMPSDVLIVTGERTLLAYLFDPLSESLHKSFRED